MMPRKDRLLRNLFGVLVLVSALLFLTGPFHPAAIEAGGIALRPPFNNVYRLNSFFDHKGPGSADGQITIYNGEDLPDCNASPPGTYCYAGHDGIDWALPEPTPVLAPANGVIHEFHCNNTVEGKHVIIDHQNGYYTLFAHLSNYNNLWVGKSVAAGDVIAFSGSTGSTCQSGSADIHLHFGVYRTEHDRNHSTDPFGWRGSYADPLLDFPTPGGGQTAECLWRGLPGDAISCFDRIVEDHYPTDGGGWSHTSTWYYHEKGNGWFAHYTFSFHQIDSTAKWDSQAGGYNPVLHHGFYRTIAFIPNETVYYGGQPKPRTTRAPYDVHYYPGSVAYLSMDQSAISDNWLDLGTYEMEPGTDYCYVYLDDYTGDADFARAILADSIKFSAELTYLPSLKSTGGWTTYVDIFNLTGSQAHVTINWYYPNGSRWGYQNFTVERNGRASPTASGFDGSAVVVSDQDVAVVVRRENSYEMAAYTGISEANWNTGWGQPGPRTYIPVSMWHPRWDSSQWESTLHIQNAGNGTAHFSITYYDATGQQLACSVSNQTLAVKAKADYTPSACDTGNGYNGAAYLLSDQPLAVAVSQEDLSAGHSGFSQYNAFTSGATKLYLPSLMRNWYSWTSSFTVQNLADNDATVHIHYVKDDGTSPPDPPDLTVHAKASVVVVQNDPTYGVPDNWHGTAILTSPNGQPIVAVVNQQYVPHAHQSYNAFLGGASTLYGPFAASSSAYDSCTDAQNVGDASTNITSAYFYPAGGNPFGGSTISGVVVGGVAMFYVPGDGVGTNFSGQVRITRSASQIAGIHNIARKPAVDDFGASYNMPQR